MWARLGPLGPGEQGGMGRPRVENRPIVDAILWNHRTGASWRDLPEDALKEGALSDLVCSGDHQ